MSARLNVLYSSFLLTMLLISGASSGAEAIPPSNEESGMQKFNASTPRVDEVALRYYASVKQTARVEAETRRLRRLHPGWEPPSDLWTARLGSSDDGPLWELFAADKIEELRLAIKARQASDRKWVLSTDLEQKLQRKELRLRIVTAALSRRWSEIAAAASNWRSEIAADDVEVLWQIAEGYARSRRTADSLQILESILKTSPESRERIATIHKALVLLPMNVAEQLIQIGKVDPFGKSEFDAIAIDITRARISALLHDAPGKDISEPELARFQDYALAAPDPNQAALLAWYALKRADPREALEYFKASIARGGDATVAHGLAHTLRKLGRLREAEEVAYAWREPSPANAILFIDILAEQLTQGSSSFDEKRLARYAEVTLQTTSGEGAQALAWYAYNSCQLDAAAEWFKRAISWFPKEPTAFGYALTLRRLKRNQEFVEIVNRYDGLFPSVISLLFPDDSARMDDPCGRKLTRGVNVNSDGAVPSALRSEIFPTSRQTATPPGRPRNTTRSTVPMPSKVGLEQTQEFLGPKSTEFPVAVALENPYRSTSGEHANNLKMSVGSWRPKGSTAPVLIARRVPGVGPMPYERYGRALLVGWNGALQPALSSGLFLQSPLGTQWSAEQASAEALQHPDIGKSPGARSANSADAVRFHP